VLGKLDKFDPSSTFKFLPLAIPFDRDISKNSGTSETSCASTPRPFNIQSAEKFRKNYY
jgi:hypothetical protein